MSRSVSAPSSVTNTSPCWYGDIVPGSTLMYGSSLRIETRRPRALNRRPMLAAVMPLPREEVTPPVTKTYFDTGQVLRGVFECHGNPSPDANRTRPDPRPDRAWSTSKWAAERGAELRHDRRVAAVVNREVGRSRLRLDEPIGSDDRAA